MKKILYLSIFTGLASLVSLSYAWHIPQPLNPPRGDVMLQFQNSSGIDLLIDSTCKKNPNDQPKLVSAGTRAEMSLFFPESGKSCQVICVDASNQQKQAVMCLDADACEVGCANPDCAGGVCDNIGLQWIRGCWGQCIKFCKQGNPNCDICVRSIDKNVMSITYGVVKIKDK